jgi:hypothetical protein
MFLSDYEKVLTLLDFAALLRSRHPGVVIGIPATIEAGHPIAADLFGISAWNPLVLGSVTALLAAVALVASATPAREARASIQWKLCGLRDADFPIGWRWSPLMNEAAIDMLVVPIYDRLQIQAGPISGKYLDEIFGQVMAGLVSRAPNGLIERKAPTSLVGDQPSQAILISTVERSHIAHPQRFTRNFGDKYW